MHAIRLYSQLANALTAWIFIRSIYTIVASDHPHSPGDLDAKTQRTFRLPLPNVSSNDRAHSPNRHPA